MRASITVSALAGATLFVAHVRNCRLLLRRAGQLAQLTKDHTWGWEQLEAAGSRRMPCGRTRRDALTRSLGGGAVVAIDSLTIAVREDDVLVSAATASTRCSRSARSASSSRRIRPRPRVARSCGARARRAPTTTGVQVAAVTSCPRGPSWWQSARDLVSGRAKCGVVLTASGVPRPAEPARQTGGTEWVS
jgi:hypothetical protein